jgi:hypothetical protein
MLFPGGKAAMRTFFFFPQLDSDQEVCDDARRAMGRQTL